MSHTNMEAVPKLLDKKILVPWNRMKSQMPRKKNRVVWAASLNVLLSRLTQGQVVSVTMWNKCFWSFLGLLAYPQSLKKGLIHQTERHKTVSLKVRIGVCLCILLRTPLDLFPSPHSEVKIFFNNCQSFLDFQQPSYHLKFSKVQCHISHIVSYCFCNSSAKGELTPVDLQLSWPSFSEKWLAARSPEGEDFGTFKFEEWSFHVGGVTSATSELFGTSWYEAWHFFLFLFSSFCLREIFEDFFFGGVHDLLWYFLIFILT